MENTVETLFCSTKQWSRIPSSCISPYLSAVVQFGKSKSPWALIKLCTCWNSSWLNDGEWSRQPHVKDRWVVWPFIAFWAKQWVVIMLSVPDEKDMHLSVHPTHSLHCATPLYLSCGEKSLQQAGWGEGGGGDAFCRGLRLLTMTMSFTRHIYLHSAHPVDSSARHFSKELTCCLSLLSASCHPLLPHRSGGKMETMKKVGFVILWQIC